MPIPILHNAIRVLESLADEPAPSARELARRLQLAPTSAYRILETFRDAGWVDQHDGGYRPGNALLRIAAPLLALAHQLNRIRPHIETLARHTGLTVVITAREGASAAVIDRADSPRAVSVMIPLHTRTPLAQSFAGPSLLAETPDDQLEKLARNAAHAAFSAQTRAQWRARIAHVKKHHWDLDPGAFHRRLAILSAPLRTSDQKIFAAVSLLGLPGELTLRSAGRFHRPLLRSVRQAARAL